MSYRHSSYRKLAKVIADKWDDTADEGAGDWSVMPTDNETDRMDTFLDGHKFREGTPTPASRREWRNWKGPKK